MPFAFPACANRAQYHKSLSFICIFPDIYIRILLAFNLYRSFCALPFLPSVGPLICSVVAQPQRLKSPTCRRLQLNVNGMGLGGARQDKQSNVCCAFCLLYVCMGNALTEMISNGYAFYCGFVLYLFSGGKCLPFICILNSCWESFRYAWRCIFSQLEKCYSFA